MDLTLGDDDFTNRWRLIKQAFSRALPLEERRSSVRIARGESQGQGLALPGALRMQRGLWQRRFWEHAIRDERDYAAHIDYCHINPVKHGYVKQVSEWPYSTFHRYVARGIYPHDWAGDGLSEMEAGERN